MSALSFREAKLGEGAIEIGVRRGSELVAVITHPCAGAAWFIHVGWTKRREKTKRAAIERVTRELQDKTQ
jgi:hypothetical protein